MPYFFEPFPTVNYDMHKNNHVSRVVNIARSFAIRKLVATGASIYYNYSIKEGDRPDIVAHKYYDDETLDWVILLTNGIINPLFDWPLDYDNFINFIKSKYGNYPTAQTQIHHYNYIIQQQSITYDGVIIPKETLEIDLTTYNATVAADKEIVYALDYEQDLNDAQRKINILDERHIPTILGQLQGIL